jgi:hypothetical protein
MSHRPGFQARAGSKSATPASSDRGRVPNGCRFDDRNERAFWASGLPARHGVAISTLIEGAAGEKLWQRGGV